MEAVIQKWGNSNAIRLPKQLLKSVDLKESDLVSLTASGNDIIIRKSEKHLAHKTLKQRLTESGISPDYKIESTEIDSSSVGDEVFW